MAAAPAVSVNICAYNASRYVGETIESVLAQTFADFEIVIVDDGSTDGTPELIESHFHDPRITIVRERHATLRFARPIALAHSTGRYVAFLDSDDLWHPEKLERQVAAARSLDTPALIVCDADLIDSNGTRFGRFSDQFKYERMNLRAEHAHLELLRHGNFIASSAPLVEAAALHSAGGFNLNFRHCNDYETWLRLARRHPIVFLDDALVSYRVHQASFTFQRLDVTLPEQCALLDPIVASAMYPVDVRRAIGDMLLGQHRLAMRALWTQGRRVRAATAALGMLRYPDRLLDSVRHQHAGTLTGRTIEGAIRLRAHAVDAAARAFAHAANAGRTIVTRGRRVPARILRALRRENRQPARPLSNRGTTAHVWIDGTSLSREQTGYFNLLVEMVRRFAAHPDCVVHVRTTPAGWAALLARVPSDPDRLLFHHCGWRALHWSQLYGMVSGSPARLLLATVGLLLVMGGAAISDPFTSITGAVAALAAVGLASDELRSQLAEARGCGRERFFARVMRFLWRRLPRPRGRAPTPNTTEILFWRGSFRWADSRRVAIVQDLTTQINPAWHTPGNVREFGEFAGYVQRHAQHILTVSECCRRDIVDRMLVDPAAVSVMPMPIHPQYASPQFDRGWLTMHRVREPYVLYVGAIEPRKNLRRLVKAFEWLAESDALRHHRLVMIGPSAWDEGFDDYLAASDVASRIDRLGFVAQNHLPSLYHFASAVVQPSLYEGFGIPVMEAMCSSGMVIAANAGSLPEVLGHDGILFDPADSRAIAAALLHALTLSPVDAEAYRKRCRQRAEAHLLRLATEPLLPGLRPLADLQTA